MGDWEINRPHQSDEAVSRVAPSRCNPSRRNELCSYPVTHGATNEVLKINGESNRLVIW